MRPMFSPFKKHMVLWLADLASDCYSHFPVWKEAVIWLIPDGNASLCALILNSKLVNIGFCTCSCSFIFTDKAACLHLRLEGHFIVKTRQSHPCLWLNFPSVSLVVNPSIIPVNVWIMAILSLYDSYRREITSSHWRDTDLCRVIYTVSLL